jgi:hypothetical protein
MLKVNDFGPSKICKISFFNIITAGDFFLALIFSLYSLSSHRETDSDIMDELGKDYFVAKPVDIIDLIDRRKVKLSQK